MEQTWSSRPIFSDSLSIILFPKCSMVPVVEFVSNIYPQNGAGSFLGAAVHLKFQSLVHLWFSRFSHVFPMCFIVSSCFFHDFRFFFQVYSQVFPHVFPTPPRPSGRNIPRSQRTPPREVESCSQARGDTKKMGYVWGFHVLYGKSIDFNGVWIGIW